MRFAKEVLYNRGCNSKRHKGDYYARLIAAGSRLRASLAVVYESVVASRHTTQECRLKAADNLVVNVSFAKSGTQCKVCFEIRDVASTTKSLGATNGGDGETITLATFAFCREPHGGRAAECWSRTDGVKAFAP